MEKQKIESEEEVTEESKKDSTENSTSGSQKSGMASRARNRTVMLSPEMTGQVRAMLNKGNDQSSSNEKVSNDWSRLEVGKPVEKIASVAAAVEDIFSSSNESVGRNNNFQGGQNNPRNTGKMNQDVINQVIGNVNRNPVPVERNTAVSTTPVYANPSSAMKQENFVEQKKEVSATSRLVGFLISFDNNEFGEMFEVRAGRWIITSRQTEQGECLVIKDQSISPMHAVVRVTKEGKVQILDQLSEYGTGITKVGSTEETDVSGSMTEVEHGDMVRFGKRHFVVCLVPNYRTPE